MKQQKSSSTVIAVVGLIAFIASWLWLLPAVRAQMADLEGKKIERQELQDRVDNLNSLVTALALTPGTPGALPISFDDLDRSLPEARLTEDLYALIDQITVDLGISNDTTITIMQSADNSIIDEDGSESIPAVITSPVQIATKTSYDGAKQLLDRLTVTLRPLSVNAVSMAPTDTGAISVTINATTYTRSSSSLTP